MKKYKVKEEKKEILKELGWNADLILTQEKYDKLGSIKEFFEDVSFSRKRVGKDMTYYFMDCGGDIYKTTDWLQSNDKGRFAIGNYFLTREEAEKSLNGKVYERKYLDKILELNEGWTPNWNDLDESKYFLKYYYDTKTLSVDYDWRLKNKSDNYYVKDKYAVTELMAWLEKEENKEVMEWFIRF